MKKPKWLIVLVMFCAYGILDAQEKSTEVVLTNSTVIEMVKASLTENIIVTKIKNSKCDFDTSSIGLVKLKEAGVGDTIITAMIEAKPKADPPKSETQKTADVKEAIGKRKVFLVTDDEESRIEIVKRFTKKGFSFVDDRRSAELVFELSYTEGTTQTKAGILRGGNENQYRSKLGKFVVQLSREANEYLVYAREYDFARAATFASAFGISATMPSLKNQVKHYFIDDFLKQMKKAGDKFK